MQESNYYPFGLEHSNYNVDKLTFDDNTANGIGGTIVIPPLNYPMNKYKYNGQEWQEELGLNITAMDYRQYDNAIGRFNAIDILTEVVPDYSPYNFAWNNPVYFSDPSGLCPECNKNVKDPKNGQTYVSTGGATYVFNNGQWARQGGQLSEVFVTASKKKSSNKSQVNKQVSYTLFGFEIMKGNVNEKGQTPLEAHREFVNYTGEHPGEDKWDRLIRVASSSSYEARREYGSGLYDMYGFPNANIAQGTYSVYRGYDVQGIVRYVGITKRLPQVRFAEHLGSIGIGKENLIYEVLNGGTNLTKEQAKVLEQQLINQYKLQKYGGQLLNKINSIAPNKQ